jgi:hypothetical protein
MDDNITEDNMSHLCAAATLCTLRTATLSGFIPYRILQQQEHVRIPFINTFLDISTTSTTIEGKKPLTLLKERTVLQWLCGDTSFLLGPLFEHNTKNKTKDNEQCKKLEDEWGQSMLTHIRPDLKKSGQWTTVVGEQLHSELQTLLGQDYIKPHNLVGYQPDGETNNDIWEVKTQTYFTSGTAGEKILGVPFKYADVPMLYNKPLKIVCIGGAERDGREQYGILPGDRTSENRRKILDFWQNELNIEFIGATDLMQQIVSSRRQIVPVVDVKG